MHRFRYPSFRDWRNEVTLEREDVWVQPKPQYCLYAYFSAGRHAAKGVEARLIMGYNKLSTSERSDTSAIASALAVMGAENRMPFIEFDDAVRNDLYAAGLAGWEVRGEWDPIIGRG